MRLTRTKTEASLEGSIDSRAAPKRQKTVHEEETMIDPSVTYDPKKNAHLKGRRRFKADLEDLKGLCNAGFVASGLRLKSIGPGEDDGSFTVDIEKTGKHILSANFLVSDTSEYPNNHSMFCHSPDPDISSRLEAIVEAVILEHTSQPIKAVLDTFFAAVSAATAPKAPIMVHSDDSGGEGEDSGEDTDHYDYDDIDDMGGDSMEPKAILSLLQTNFLDIVASSYKPGLTRISGGDDFILSVSVPVVHLAESIPPRALMAWDRRLLASSHNHLVLLISGFRGTYPIIGPDGAYTPTALRLLGGTGLAFKVGLCVGYKPGEECAKEAVRKHGLVGTDAEDEVRMEKEKAERERVAEFWDAEGNFLEEAMAAADAEAAEKAAAEQEEEEMDPERFDRFSLSSSLESLMDQEFLRLVQFRRKFALGWAGAEALYHETEKHQRVPEDVLAAMLEQITAADKEESLLSRNITLPHDPLAGLSKNEPINLPLTAFSYLIRRLTLCTKYCIVCHSKLNTDYEALKPYVCGSKLCSYQYYSLNRGPSLEYEIMHNPKTVDLLVSLAYVSATEGSMEDPLPVGMGLRVVHPGELAPGTFVPMLHPASAFGGATMNGVGSGGAGATAGGTGGRGELDVGEDGLVEFDELTTQHMRAVISRLIETLPSIDDMKKHLERKVQLGKSKPKLRDIDPSILPAAWLILRWIVCSCTAYIEEITSGTELIQNLDRNWRQFRLTVGAPDAESKFRTAVNEAVTSNSNAAEYPVLYAFHGSPLKNWHSIVRHGLWYKQIAHGRAYGNGVYLAKDANISMGSYALGARAFWKNSQTSPSSCVALAEVVNLPGKFVSNNPYFVVADTTWIMCRYLLIKGSSMEAPIDPIPGPAPTGPVAPASSSKKKKGKQGSDESDLYVKIDPAHKTVVGGTPIRIPDPLHQLETVLEIRKAETVEQDFDEEDLKIFNLDVSRDTGVSAAKGKERRREDSWDAMDIDDDDDYRVPPRAAAATAVSTTSQNRTPFFTRPKDDWKPNAAYVERAVSNLMLPPFESSGGASMALQKELRAMKREQEGARSLKELGWWMPEVEEGDNLYQWIVEMHSFDEEIPIAKDMKKHKVNSVIFEIRFPPTFPIAPPFFRIITPRFLPFIHGGGGHVTGGGSICMDLLTSNGWLPSYTIPAVLMQIKLAISNLDPRPARLASNWQQPYSVAEALAGYKRAAATHGWTVPDGLERLVR